jgi:hypothetical protein
MSSTDQAKNDVAQEKYGKDFDELDGKQRQSAAGTVGGRQRADQAGSEGMAEMGKKGGSVTKEDTSSS